MKLGTVTIHNLLSYEHLKIEFSDLGHALFVGKNGSGKTSIFDIICWIFYGQMPRKRYKKIVRDVPKRQVSGMGIVSFYQSQDEYTITRTDGNDLLTLECNGIPIELRTPSLIQLEIDRIVGMDFKTFLNVAYFSQGDVGKFLNSTSTERIDVISNVLNFNEIDKMIKEIDKEINIAEREISEAQGKLMALEEQTSDVDGKEMNKRKKQMESELKKYLIDFSSLNNYINNCELKKELEDNKNEVTEKFQRAKGVAKKLLHQNKKQISYLSDKEYDFKGINDKIKELSDDLAILYLTDERLVTVNSEVDKINQSIANIEGKRKYKKDESAALKKIIELKGTKCPTCIREIDEDGIRNVNKIIEIVTKEIETMSKKILKLRNDLEIRKKEKLNLEDEKKELDKVEKKKVKLETELGQTEKDEIQIDELKETNKIIKYNLEVDLKSATEQIDIIKQQLKKYLSYDLEKLSVMEGESTKMSEKISELESDLKVIKADMDRYDDAIKRLNKIKKILEQHQETYEIKSYWKKALPKVKIRMISEVIPFLETEANKYLSQILPGHYIYFKADPNKKQNKLDVDIEDTVHNIKRPIEGWSGGEKDKMSLSAYLSLNKLASLRSGKEIDFIILDEKLMSVDVETRPLVFEMLKNEYKNRKIWMISHLKDVETEFNQIIHIKKVGGVSGIEISKN